MDRNYRKVDKNCRTKDSNCPFLQKYRGTEVHQFSYFAELWFCEVGELEVALLRPCFLKGRAGLEPFDLGNYVGPSSASRAVAPNS